MGSFSLL
jgi:hypothetical protein